MSDLDGESPGEAADTEAAADAGTAPEATAEAGPVRTPSSRILVKWTAQVVVVALFVGGVLAALSTRAEPVALWMAAAVAGVLLVVGLVWTVLRYRAWAFQIRSDHLYLERGVYRQVETMVPYVRVQHVDTSRGPVSRALGLSTLVIYTAGSRGADVSIPGLPADEAESLQERVKGLAIAAEGSEPL